MPMQAGELRFKVGFYQRIVNDDGYGNTQSGFSATAAFTCRANIEPKLGGEKVLADRLTGTNYVNITVRRSSNTRTVDTDWKLKDEHSGVEYNIRSIIDPDKGTASHGRMLEMLCEEGVAIGAVGVDSP